MLAPRRSALSQSDLRFFLSYDPDSGHFKWVNPSPKRKELKGQPAGGLNAGGYLTIFVGGQSYMGHRLAWLYTYGVWPEDDLDHANGNRSDNRILNLRPCTRAENRQNCRRSKSNRSGFLGVSWSKLHSKWRAQICVDRKTRHLGLFTSAESAYEAYTQAKAALHTFQPKVREQC